jgi:hypothetical protein
VSAALGLTHYDADGDRRDTQDRSRRSPSRHPSGWLMGELKAGLGSNSIQLCIEMQRLFARRGQRPTPWMERVLLRVVRLSSGTVAHAFYALRPTALAERRPRDVAGLLPAMAMLDLVPPLSAFVPPAETFNRMQYSAFADGQFHPLLRGRGIDTIITVDRPNRKRTDRQSRRGLPRVAWMRLARGRRQPDRSRNGDHRPHGRRISRSAAGRRFQRCRALVGGRFRGSGARHPAPIRPNLQ